MISLRYLFLLGLVLLVKGASVIPAYVLDFEDAQEDFIETYNAGENLRVRREANEKETADKGINSAEGSGPRLNGDGECECPPPSGHRHPCHGLSRQACREKMMPRPYNGPPCELRMLVRPPSEFNVTARQECFDKWEKPVLEEKGMDLPMHRGFMRPPFFKTLIINKGCDAQCMFFENGLVVEDESAVTLSKDALMEAFKEEDDPQELTDVYAEIIDKCIQEAGELVHPKQSCKSGADEFMACFRHNLSKDCPGGKWKGNKACADIEDSETKMRDCRRQHRAMFAELMQRYPRGPKDFRF